MMRIFAVILSTLLRVPILMMVSSIIVVSTMIAVPMPTMVPGRSEQNYACRTQQTDTYGFHKHTAQCTVCLWNP